MTALGQVLIVISVLAGGIIYGTDVFSAIVLRPALALVDDRTLVSAMGRVHDFGDRRLRLPGVARAACRSPTRDTAPRTRETRSAPRVRSLDPRRRSRSVETAARRSW